MHDESVQVVKQNLTIHNVPRQFIKQRIANRISFIVSEFFTDTDSHLFYGTPLIYNLSGVIMILQDSTTTVYLGVSVH